MTVKMRRSGELEVVVVAKEKGIGSKVDMEVELKGKL
jgi:hypothetical protein